MSRTPRSILAIDPGTKHMGVAVLQDEDLVYYGVKSFKERRPADQLLRATRDLLIRLIEDYRPGVLAYEKTFYVQQKSSALLHVQEFEIARVGRAKGLAVVGHSPQYVRKLLCGDGRAPKEVVADILVRRFPELSGYRTARTSRHRAKYWLNMFDAVAVAVACLDGIGLSESATARRAA